MLGALYMLRFALGFLYGAAKAPHQPLADLDLREKAILAAIVAAVFCARPVPGRADAQDRARARKAYQQLVTSSRCPGAADGERPMANTAGRKPEAPDERRR